MAWSTPEFSKQEYDLAGKALVKQDQSTINIDTALQIINNWRSSHYHPLNTFQTRLRRKSQTIDPLSTVAQRIKRLYSIRHKLERFPSMRLTQIQDIGGCRAILSNLDGLHKLVNVMAIKDKERSGRGIKHKLIDEKDYINDPKISGYRGVHLIFRYYSDKVKDFDGLKIEIQFRTFYQHAWATAVETVGIFIGQALKSSIGQQEWLRFFALASSAIAINEGTPTVPNTPEDANELKSELRMLANQLEVDSHLRAYSKAINSLDEQIGEDAHYYLVELDAEKKSIKVFGYKQKDFEKAASDYLDIEKNIRDKNADAVLVSADSITALKKAYPNYFVDTEIFLDVLNKVMG